MRNHVIVPQIRNLANAELKSARERDEHIQMGLSRVPEDLLWAFFLRKLNSLEATVKRQEGK